MVECVWCNRHRCNASLYVPKKLYSCETCGKIFETDAESDGTLECVTVYHRIDTSDGDIP